MKPRKLKASATPPCAASDGASAAQALPADWSPLDRLRQTELVRPCLANHYGTLFGPEGLALLGKAAYAVAARFTGQAVVMAAASDIEFLRPMPVGSLIHTDAQVVRTKGTSLTVQVCVSLDAAPGTQAPEALRGRFKMVTVDALGRPTPLRPRSSPKVLHTLPEMAALWPE